MKLTEFCAATKEVEAVWPCRNRGHPAPQCYRLPALSLDLCEDPGAVPTHPGVFTESTSDSVLRTTAQEPACKTFEHSVRLYVQLFNAALAVLVCWGDRLEALETPTPHSSGSQKSTPKGRAELAPPEGPDGLSSMPLPSVPVVCWQSRARLG